jgi:hypothetical protein
MIASIVFIALAFAAQTPVSELRAALDDLRAGKPGEARFEAALPKLPDLLTSRSSFFVAGAAYLAGMHGRRECAGALREALSIENGRAKDADSAPRSAIFDALIRLEIAAPPELVLGRSDAEFASQCYLVLALEHDEARRAEGFAKLVQLGWATTAAHWAAAGRLAEARDASGFVAVLTSAPWDAIFAVRDRGSERVSSAGGGGGGWSTSHDSWPPRVSYKLALPKPDEPLGAITFERFENTRSGTLAAQIRTHERIERRARVMRAYVGGAPELALGPDAVIALHDFKNAAACAGAALDHAERVRARITAVARALAETAKLEDLERVLARVRIRVHIEDRRTDAEPPLAIPLSTESIEFVSPGPRAR